MEHAVEFEWVEPLRPAILSFLGRLRGQTQAGFYRFSLTGDVNVSEKWGLGNAVFAAKICAMLSSAEAVRDQAIADFILSFQQQDGYLSDPFVERQARFLRWLTALRQWDATLFSYEPTRRAETRQAFAALASLGHRPLHPFLRLPYDPEGIRQFIHSLNWRTPWAAASHVGHLLFFLRYNADVLGVRTSDADPLIDCVLSETERYRQPDGSWHEPGCTVSAEQRVNAAMKMLTGFAAAKREEWTGAESLIDLCLAATQGAHACNHFNVVCVLHHCVRKTPHRRAEAEIYLLHRLRLFREHYWPAHGGFSFYKGRANHLYYFARVTRGLPEPDIHGTSLFLWGIVLIADALGWRERLGLSLPIT